MKRLLSIVWLPAACAAALTAAQPARSQWWAPGDGRPLPAYVEYANPSGRLGIVNASGAVETKGHPFFEAIGTNGRACVSCHQPADGMSLAVSSIVKRWHDTKGKDPIFAAIDGANCPNLPAADPEVAFAVARARTVSGPIAVAARRRPRPPDRARIHDRGRPRSHGCNTDRIYGVTGERHEVSVYRRPRPAANLRYVASARFGVTPFIGKTGAARRRRSRDGPARQYEHDGGRARGDAQDAGTIRGARTSRDRSRAHCRRRWTRFTISSCSSTRRRRPRTGPGALNEPGGPSGLGPEAMAQGSDGVLGNNTTRFVIPMEDKWARPARRPRRGGARAQRVPGVRAARPRRVLLPDVLDPRCDAHQLGGAR